MLHSCKVRTEWGKISAQPHTTLCIQFLDRENSDKNNRLPLGKQICFTIVWGCAEILPFRATSRCFSAYRAALKTKSDLIFCGILYQICWLCSFDSAFEAIVSSRTSNALHCASCATFLFLPDFDVICDLLLNRCTATWNLFVNWICCWGWHVLMSRYRVSKTLWSQAGELKIL